MLVITSKNGTPFEWHKHSGFIKNTPKQQKEKICWVTCPLIMLKE
jgi:hypothetical protein